MWPNVAETLASLPINGGAETVDPQRISPQPYPSTLCIHQLFEKQVRRTPEAIALVDRTRIFTYRALNEHTNQLAHLLRQKGVGPETVVGCYLSRSTAIVQCLLAVLKAGGAYLLLDPHLPAQRLRYMVENAEPKLTIADAPLPKTVQKATAQAIMLVDAITDAKQCAINNIRSSAKPSNAAYIAYTSGSTGQPKGVIITHQATVNHSYAFSQLFHLTTKDCTPIMAPIAFDMATEEIIPPLISGCRLIVSSSRHTVMSAFHKEILARGYTILNMPAPLWHMWTEYLHDRQLPVPENLRLVIVGSDKIYTSRFLDWKHLPGARRVTWAAAYGTTETTVTSSFYTTAWDDDLTVEPTIPIGKPIANTKFYILDEHNQPVQGSTVGELYIGGHGVARGYHKRADLTRERFVFDPFSTEPNARMYRTGDLARFRPDGNVVCLGRKDFQVKINGLRIELEEIEIVLAKHPAVSQAIVVLREAPEAGKGQQLTAFITLRPNVEPPRDLHAFVSRRLHPYMVPKRFVVLSRLLLNVNGKVDRKALERCTTVSSGIELHG